MTAPAPTQLQLELELWRRPAGWQKIAPGRYMLEAGRDRDGSPIYFYVGEREMANIKRCLRRRARRELEGGSR